MCVCVGGGRTLELEREAFAGGDEGTCLAHAGEGVRDFLGVAARHAVCEHVDVVPCLNQVERGLEYAYVRLECARVGVEVRWED